MNYLIINFKSNLTVFAFATLFCFAPVNPATAMSLPIVFKAFDINSAPQNSLELARHFASNQDFKFKFPFSYKDVVYITDTSIPDLNRIEFCISADAKQSDHFILEIKAVGKGNLFSKDSKLFDFDFKSYVKTTFSKAFSKNNIRVTQNPRTEFNSVCKEVEHITWPNHIH